MEKKKDILDKGAIVQRDGRTYAVTPRIPVGLIKDFDILRRIADVAERYGAEAIKVTSSQRLTILGIREEDIDQVWAELGMSPGMASGLCIRSIKACPGTSFCRLGQQDAMGLGLRLEERYANMATPNKLKISVSGCPLDCAEGRLRDIGLVGSKKGYTLYVGGCGGASPRIAEPVVRNLDAAEAEQMVDRLVAYYQQSGTRKRLGDHLAREGMESLKKALDL